MDFYYRNFMLWPTESADMIVFYEAFIDRIFKECKLLAKVADCSQSAASKNIINGKLNGRKKCSAQSVL